MAHPAVTEACVIGKPDPVAGEVVKAIVVLKPGSKAVRALAQGAPGTRPPAPRGGGAQGESISASRAHDPATLA
jgi:acyl-CoA synthetase (AMP-forming)/AMP-acid ligase II